MDDDDDFDTHICLGCQATILGLESYIQHKKFECPAKKSNVHKPRSSAGPTTTASAFNITSPSAGAASSMVSRSVVLSTAAVTTSPALSVDVSSGGVDSVDVNHVEDSLVPSTLSLTPTTNVQIDGSTMGTNTFSPTSSRVVDPNMVLYNTRPSEDAGQPVNWNEFFSSLELQSRGPIDKHKVDPDTKEPKVLGDGQKVDAAFDESKTLRIVNLLNDLDFSSDSEGFLPSDAEDLLNFSDVDDMEDPPHTGGKWRPGSHPSPSHTRGKWKPGTKPMQQHTRGRGRPPGKGRGKNLSKLEAFEKQKEKEAEPAEPPKTGGKGKRSRGGKRPINYAEDSADEEEEEETMATDADAAADVTEAENVMDAFIKAATNGTEGDTSVVEMEEKECKEVETVVTTADVHLQPDDLDPDDWAPEMKFSPARKKPKPVIGIQCHVCSRTFNNKYGFVRHLASAYHIKREKVSNPPYILEESFQKLLLRQKPFQCRVCSFYCNEAEVLSEHVNTEAHIQAASTLLGPILCVRCKKSFKTNKELLAHMSEPRHEVTIAESSRPCIIREIRKELACPTCKVVKHSAMALAKHMKVSHGGCLDKVELRKYRHKAGIFSKLCPHCGKQCANHQVLALHIRRRHTNERPYRCTHCDIGYAESVGLQIHLRSKKHALTVAGLGDLTYQADGTFTRKQHKYRVSHKCRFCDHRSVNITELRNHMNLEHPDMVKYCDICGVSFDRENLYDKHLLGRDHKRQVENSLSADAESLECTHCGKKFYDSKHYKLHVLQHTQITTESKLKELSGNPLIGIASKYHAFVDSLPVLVRKGDRNSLKCPECKMCLRYENMIGHLRKHSGSQPFECVYCGQRFASAYFLNRHLRSHLGLNSYKCDLCGQEFHQKAFLRTHKLRKHNDADIRKDAHKCELCNMAYIHKHQLKVHMQRHTGKRFKCTWPGCKRSFVQPSELDGHMRVHTNIRPFLCDFCGYSAKMKNQLTRHRRRHTGDRRFACEYCSYKSINSTNLRRHMRIHIGTKPFKCPHCDYRCNTIENVRKHIKNTKKHVGLPVYPCKLCTFGTDVSNEFRDHLEDIHEITGNNSTIISVYCGLYEKETDIRRVPEGSRALPCRDVRPNHNVPATEPTTTVKKKPKPDKQKKKHREHREQIVVAKTDQIQLTQPIQLEQTTTHALVKMENSDDHAYSTAGYGDQHGEYQEQYAILNQVPIEQVEVETAPAVNHVHNLPPIVYYTGEMDTVYIVKQDE